MGDAIATNMFMLGYAYQKGWVPVAARGARARHRAERRRGRVQPARASSGAGAPRSTSSACGASPRPPRRDPDRPALLAQPRRAGRAPREVPDRLPGRRLRARSTGRWSTRCRAVEKEKANSSKLAEAVARYYAKLLAYKDEYEVGAPAQRPAIQQEDRRHVRGRLQGGLPPRAAAARARPTRSPASRRRSASAPGWAAFSRSSRP